MYEVPLVTAGTVIQSTEWGNMVANAVTPTPWVDVTFQNSWVNQGAGFQAVQYRKVNDVVQIRGNAKSGLTLNPMFTLPIGFRPLEKVIYVVDGDGTSTTSRVTVTSSGGVIPDASSNTEFEIGFIQFSDEA